MNALEQISHNKCIVIPVLMWLSIQIFKFLTDLVKNRKVNFKRVLGAGGMPSSHSAVVCSLAVCVGREYGFDSGIFAIASILALVVMYDAAGVRRAAGKQARILNKIIDNPNLTSEQVQEKLVEALGHTPVEVFVGAVLGVVVGFVA